MQTVAKFAKRLDMTAEEAVETLRRLRFDVADVETEISDAQCDMLIDIDEDSSNLDKFLARIEKEEEERRKRTERLKKAAAKKRATPKKPAAEEVPEAKEEAEAVKRPKRAKKAAEEVPAEGVTAEILPSVEGAAPAAEAKGRVTAEIMAEIAPAEKEREKEKEKARQKKEPPAILIGAAAELDEPVVEVVRADGTHAGAAEIELVDKPVEPVEGEEEEDLSSLTLIQRRQEEEWRKKNKGKIAKPLPTPDPEVVAEVIRKAHERSVKKSTKGRATTEEDGSPLRSGWKGGVTGKTARKKQKRAERQRVVDEEMRREAAIAVREVQAGGIPGAAKKRRKKRDRDENLVTEEESGGVIEVEDRVTVERLADLLQVSVNDIILDLMEEDILATKNQVLDMELVRRIADGRGFEVRAVIPEEEDLLAEVPDHPEDLKTRAPVVTVMGHVDHGKTSLLDHIRRTKVAAGEAGGITQHIAAYDVELASGHVTFLDTPGHEAFTQMRARGAQATDIVVLVVAADDGVKPQTIEAIDHAKAAGVPVVVAINKCDKPDAQPDRVRQELTRFELVDEAWGGKTIIKNISAITGEGVDELIEMLALQAEVMELKANSNKRARGVIIESELSLGHGPVAWVLVQNGKLRTGDVFLSGSTHGRVRTMLNSRGEQIVEAGPSTPVLVTGFSETPNAGDIFVVAADERGARSVAQKRAEIERQKRGPAVKHMTLEDFHARMAGVEKKTLNIIIKADAQGSVDVLQSSFLKLGNEEVSVSVVHSGVGGINSSDVLLASASDAVIIGFHVTANPKVQKLAEEEGVEIRVYLIIYEAIEEVRHALEGLLAPETREVIVGHAEVRQLFKSSAIGTIAGCYQTDGTSERGALARLVRDGVVIHSGKIGSLRRNKDDVRSVNAGFECGIKLERYDDLQPGDIIETYRLESVAKTLS
ncbi:MAG: translation initiation factor IF-2 [Candidatus Hydrogenedentes bacterium]|nr:translation initiation factor IF-2 [Candidatus Hydrogenedentota bacterium]